MQALLLKIRWFIYWVLLFILIMCANFHPTINITYMVLSAMHVRMLYVVYKQIGIISQLC